MKSTKKALLCSILALVLCCSMLVGTTFAWFTDSVTSKGNIIQSGSLDVEMYWADGGKAVPTAMDGWTDASTGAMFKNTLWEPGYAEAKHIMIANEGTLALNYKLRIVANGYVSKLADVIDVYYYATATATTRDVAGATYLGTLAQILGAGVSSANSLYRTVNGTLEAGKTTSLTLVMKMRESAGNEYQNLSIGTDFSVELIATQAAVESDSFGSDYDAKVPDYEMPYALVRPLEDLKISATVNDFGNGVPAQDITLNTAYQFEPTIFNQHPDGNNVEDDVDSSFYKQWHADFYVYADRDLPANAIGLAGSYDLFAPHNGYNWVAITNENDEIPANQGVRLLDSMFNNPCIVTYKNLCQYANDGIGFQCGAYAINAAALAGTTLTVELRLYETTVDWTESSHGVCEETGKFITVGEFEYTFPAYEVKNQADLEAALTKGAKDIVVPAGTYTFPADKMDADTTLYCEGTVFTGAKLNANGATVIGATFNNAAQHNTVNGVYKNCTFTGSNGLRWGYAGETVVFEDCVFSGNTYGAHFDSGANEVIFRNCTFSGFNAMGGAITKLTMEGCTFVANGKSNYNGINLWGNTELKDCTFVFDGSVGNEWVDLCNDNQTVIFTNCVVTDGVNTESVATVVGNYGDNNTIVVDGATLNIPNMDN